METEKIIVPVEVNTGGVSDLTAKIDSLSKNLGGYTNTLRTQYRQAVVELQKVSETYGETSIQAAKAAKAAAELRDRIGDSNKLIQTFDPDVKFKALQGSLTGVVSGFQAVIGAQALFGSQSKEVEQTLLKVQSVMALTGALDNIFESAEAFKNLGLQIKATTAFQSAYNFVKNGTFKLSKDNAVALQAETTATNAQATATKSATVATSASSVALRAFRAAIISTGIGLLVIALAELIANFDKVVGFVQKAVNWFSSLGEGTKTLLTIMFPLIAVIRGIGVAWEGISGILERFGVIDDENTKNMKKNAEAQTAITDKRQKEINDDFDFRIELAKAEGRDTYELEKQKRMALLETARTYLQVNQALVMSGQATKEQIEMWNTQMGLIKKLKEEQAIDDAKKDTETKKAARKRSEEHYKELLRQHEQFKKDQDKAFEDELNLIRKATSKKYEIQRISAKEFFDGQKEMRDKDRKDQEDKENAQIAKLNNIAGIRIANWNAENEAKLKSNEDYNKRLEELDLREKELNKSRAESYLSTASVIGQSFMQIAQTMEEGSEAAKTFAIAGVIVNSAQAIGAVLMKSSEAKAEYRKMIGEGTAMMAKGTALIASGAISLNPKMVLDGKAALKAGGVIAKTGKVGLIATGVSSGVQVAAITAAAAAQIKGIKNSKSGSVGGGSSIGGGGGGVEGTSGGGAGGAGFAPAQLFGIGGQQIQQMQGMPAQRVIVVEQDITRVQQRINQIRRASIQGG